MVAVASLLALGLFPLNCAAQLPEKNLLLHDEAIRITKLELGFAVQKATAQVLGCPFGMQTVRKVLKDYFGNQVSAWKATLQPNGDLSDIALYKSSGSDEIDRKANRILSSTPRIKDRTGEVVQFVISFPAISPAPIAEAISPNYPTSSSKPRTSLD